MIQIKKPPAPKIQNKVLQSASSTKYQGDQNELRILIMDRNKINGKGDIS